MTLACRVGVGIGEAATQPAGTSILFDFFPSHRRGFALAVQSAALANNLISYQYTQASTIAQAMLERMRANRDGVLAGINWPSTLELAKSVSIPVIASGGAGNVQHMVDAVVKGGASAVLAASIFHFGKHTVGEAKQLFAERGIPVRP